MKHVCRNSTIVLMMFCSAIVNAQDIQRAIGSIPGASDAGIVQKRLQSQAPALPEAPLRPISEVTPAEQAPSPESQIKFQLNGIIIKGNTAFPTNELEAIFRPSFGKTISLVDLQNLVGEVTKKYRAAGYILSRAILPPQTIKNGVVEVQVIEGFVGQIVVKGNPGWDETLLRRYSLTILQQRPLKISDLEKAILMMNNLPGVAVKAVLTPSKTIPGAADLTLATERSNASAYVSYDNYGTRFLGPQEFGVGGTVYGKTLPGSSDTLRYMTVPQTSRMEYVEFMHTNPIGNNGAKLTLDANYTNTVPGFTLDPLDVVGRSNAFYADYSYPVILSRNENFTLHAMGTYNNVSSTILSQPFYADFIRSAVIGGEYSKLDKWHGLNDVRLDIEKGFDILGAQQHVRQSRPLGVPDFAKLNLTMSRLQALPWNLSLYAATTGQYSFEPLLASEQFSYGGPIWGRGYDPSEIIGDDGAAFTIELRKDKIYGKRFLGSIQYYAFYDAGIIWNRDGVSLLPKQSATSIGFGGRIAFMPSLSGNFYYAKPLTHSRATQVAMGKDPLAPRIFFQVVLSYI